MDNNQVDIANNCLTTVVEVHNLVNDSNNGNSMMASAPTPLNLKQLSNACKSNNISKTKSENKSNSSSIQEIINSNEVR